MKTLIRGKKYHFYVVADETQFYIEAVHTASLRCSFINNLNSILSEFNIRSDDPRASESQWIMKNRQSSRVFFKKALGLLSNGTYLGYLEDQLDKDREYGEWENHKRV